MSSNIHVNRICKNCGKEFEAKTTVTKYCSHTCNNQAYKARKRSTKVEISNEQTRQIKTKPVEDLRTQEYLTVEESARLVRVSRRTLYRMNERGELLFSKISRRTLIRRSDIDRLFERPTLSPMPEPVPVALTECYTMKEVMQKYGISEKALYELIKRNNITKQYSGIYAYIQKALIDKLLSPSTQP